MFILFGNFDIFNSCKMRKKIILATELLSAFLCLKSKNTDSFKSYSKCVLILKNVSLMHTFECVKSVVSCNLPNPTGYANSSHNRLVSTINAKLVCKLDIILM